MSLTNQPGSNAHPGAGYDPLDLTGHELDETKQPLIAKLRNQAVSYAERAKAALAGNPTARARGKISVECSIRASDGPLYYGDDGYWHACFRLSTIPLYSGLSESMQFGHQMRLATLLKGLQGRHGVLRVWGEDLNVEQLREYWLQEAILAPDDTIGWEAYTAKVEQQAAATYEESFKVRIFALDVRLDDRLLGGSARTEQDYHQYQLGKDQFGINHPGNHRLVKSFAEMLEIAQGSYRTARPMAQDEVLGMYLRSNWRGAPESPAIVFPNDGPVSSPNKLAWLGEGNELDLIDMLRVDYMGEVGFVSYLALAVMPPNDVPCPGLEYLWLNDEAGDPLDVIIHFEVIPPAQIRLKMEGHDAKVKEFSDELRKHNGAAGQDDINDILDVVADYLGHAKADKPGVKFTVTLAITGHTQDEVRHTRRSIIRGAQDTDVKGNEVVWVVPHGLQSDLHAMCTPGNKTVTERYLQEAEPLALAGGMPNATDVPSIIGRRVGLLTGRDRAPLLWSPESVLRPDADVGTVIVVVGPPGQGKTSLIMDLAIAQAQAGSFAIVREGSKGDTTDSLKLDQVEHLPRHNKLDISTEAGCFNPGLWGKSFGERSNNLASFLAANSSNWQKENYGSLYRVCSEEIAAHPDAPDFRNVIQALKEEGGDLRRISDDLAQLSDLDEANICRGNRKQSERLILGLRPGLTVWSNTRWLLPTAEKEPNSWSPLERFSVSALQLQFGWSREVALVRRRRTFTADDEFHERAGLADGVSDFNLHGRWGRSLGSIYLIATHGGGPEDIPNKFVQFATQAVAFRPPSDEVAIAYSRLMGVANPSDQFIADLRTLGCDESGVPIPELKGEAMLKHWNGQIVRGKFTREYIGTKAFNTTSDTHQRALLAS